MICSLLSDDSRGNIAVVCVFYCDYYSADRNEGASANCRDIFSSERTGAAVLTPTLFYVNPQERKPQAQRDWLDLL
jgi:hypothetical protein